MAFGDIRYYNYDEGKNKSKNERVTYLGMHSVNPQFLAAEYNIPLMEVEITGKKLFFYIGEPENDINFLSFVFSNEFGKVTKKISNKKLLKTFYYCPSYNNNKEEEIDEEYLRVPFFLVNSKKDEIIYKGINTKTTALDFADMYNIKFFKERESSEIYVCKSSLDNLRDYFNELKKIFFKALILDDIFTELDMNDLSDKTVKYGLKLMKKMRGE